MLKFPKYWRFSLRALLGFVTFMSIVFALIGMKLRESRRLDVLREHLSRMGAVVHFDWEGLVWIREEVGRSEFIDYFESDKPWSQRVASIEFTNTTITPETNELLSRCGPIQRLCFDHCRIPGDVWQSMQAIEAVECLEFRGTPLDDLRPLKVFRPANLRCLVLHDCGLTTAACNAISACARLEILDCSGNPVSSNLSQTLESLTALRRLDISATLVDADTIASFARCRSLRLIEAYHTRLSESAGLQVLKGAGVTVRY